MQLFFLLLNIYILRTRISGIWAFVSTISRDINGQDIHIFRIYSRVTNTFYMSAGVVKTIWPRYYYTPSLVTTYTCFPSRSFILPTDYLTMLIRWPSHLAFVHLKRLDPPHQNAIIIILMHVGLRYSQMWRLTNLSKVVVRVRVTSTKVEKYSQWQSMSLLRGAAPPPLLTHRCISLSISIRCDQRVRSFHGSIQSYYLRLQSSYPSWFRAQAGKVVAVSCLAPQVYYDVEIAVSYRDDNKTEPVFYLNVTSERGVGRMKEEDIPME